MADSDLHHRAKPSLRRTALTAGAIALGAVILTAAAGVIPAEQVPVMTLPEVQRNQKLSCPVLGGPGTLHVTSPSVTVTDLAGQKIANPTAPNAVTKPIIVSSTEPGLRAGVTISSTTLGEIWVPCEAPTSADTVMLPDAGTGDMMLVNPDNVDAVVNLSLQGPSGDITSAGSRGITVAPGTVRIVPLSVLAPANQPLTVHLKTTTGRVNANVRVTRAGASQSAVQALVPTQVLTGIPSGSNSVRLLLNNPGTQRVRASIEALGVRGIYNPAGAESISIEPLSTVSIDLTKPLNKEAVAIRVTSDGAPISAVGVVTLAKGIEILNPTPAATKLVDVSGGGVLQIANPSTIEANVSVTSNGKTMEATVQPGSMASFGTVGAGAITIESDQPVSGAVINVSHGISVAGLRGVDPPTAAEGAKQDPGLR